MGEVFYFGREEFSLKVRLRARLVGGGREIKERAGIRDSRLRFVVYSL